MKRTVLMLATIATLALAAPAAVAEALSGAAAQSSPEADAFLAYEQALMDGGLDAARPFMTAEKLAELQGMEKMFGAEGFKQFLDRMRSGAQGDARRAQIQKVDIDGDQALLEARDGPNAVTVQHLARVDGAWKVSVRP